MDPRHLQRIKTIQNLFAYSFEYKKSRLPYSDSKTKLVIQYRNKIDELIKMYAPKYPLKNIAKTDLAILRLSVYDLAIEKKLPHKVVIDEAVILAKELSGERSYAFVNAVLGKILTQIAKIRKTDI